MQRCMKCVMPSTRPDISFAEDGTCSACSAFLRRPAVDWVARERELQRWFMERKTHPVYDCVVASSGGKDSTFIALTARRLGHRPLIVTAATDFLTDIGRRNVENLKRLGFDYLEFTPNPVVRRKLNRIALETVGDIEWPEHALVFSQPVRIARDMGIGLVLFGELAQNDLSGGPQDAIRLDKRWREEYGGLLGLRPADLIGREGITAADMAPYEWPDRSDDVHALFLGQFVPWDGHANAELAKAHGFETYGKPVEGNLWDCENLDDAIIGIHYYMIWVKFGFGRATTTASLDIRHGRLTRDEAVRLVREVDGYYPESYLGVPLDHILGEIGLTRDEFHEIVDRFANKKLMERTAPGHWRLRPEHAL